MIRLLRDPIDLAALQATSPADGALCLFAGIVRNENKGKAVLYLEYEAYEDMALSLMEEIAAEARRKWPITDLRMVHRLGRLEIGEPSVSVAVASPLSFVLPALRARTCTWYLGPEADCVQL